MNLTPMMKQYYKLKKQHQDKFLFFRLGDFYELFENDAKEASRILSILLTKRNGIPMCGIPHHQFNNYAHKIIKLGKKIAIAEQMNDASADEKIISRKVTKILSPGMILEENILTTGENNFILFLEKISEQEYHFLNVDISTGEIFFSKIYDDFSNRIKSYLNTYNPKEIVFHLQNFEENFVNEIKTHFPEILCNDISIEEFDEQKTLDITKKLFGDELILIEGKEAILKLFFTFIQKNDYKDMLHLREIKEVNLEENLILDYAAIKHLEIFENQFNELKNFTLLNSLDYTLTPIGKRLLRRNLIGPLKDIKKNRK